MGRRINEHLCRYCILQYVKVYATYSNGDADGPSDTASGYNKESVVTDKIYENGPYRQYFVSGKIRDTSSSGYQYGNEDSPLFK